MDKNLKYSLKNTLTTLTVVGIWQLGFLGEGPGDYLEQE